MPTKSLLVLTQTPIICNTLFLHAQKILLSFFTVKHGQSINFSETKNFFPLFDSRQYLFKIMTLRVFPQLSKISKFINLYKNSSGHLSSFHQRCAPLENTSGSHSGCVIPESIVSHFSSFLSCVLTGQWVNFTAAYVTFENTSPFLSLSLSLSMIQQLWSSITLTYIPSSLIGVMTTSRWCHRPTDVTTTPLRDHWEQPRFYIPSHPPSPLLVHRLALHDFSALCISSESLMAVSCLIHADIPSDNERDLVSGIFVYRG